MGRLVEVDKIGLNDIEIVMCEGSYKKALEMLIDKINNTPIVDAVPVVRCKDCIYGEWWGNFEFDIGQYFCEFMDGDVELKGDDFCSRGKRRETDDETD